MPQKLAKQRRVMVRLHAESRLPGEWHAHREILQPWTQSFLKFAGDRIMCDSIRAIDEGVSSMWPEWPERAVAIAALSSVRMKQVGATIIDTPMPMPPPPKRQKVERPALSSAARVLQGPDWLQALVDMSPYLPAFIGSLFTPSGDIDWLGCNAATEKFMSKCTGRDAGGIVLVQSGPSNMTRTLGKTSPPRGGVQSWIIKIGHNKKYTCRADFVWTLIHEISHVICNSHGLQFTRTCPCKGHRGHRGHGHDNVWKCCCAVLGVEEISRIHSRALPQRFLSLVDAATASK